MSWDVKEYRRNIKTLWKRYNESTSYQEKSRILNNIQRIADLICGLEFEKHDNLLLPDNYDFEQIIAEEANAKEMITAQIINSIGCTLAVPYLTKFTKDLRGFDGVDSITFAEDHEPMLSTKDLRDLTRAFFAQTTEEIYKYYQMFPDKKIVFNTDRAAGNGYTFFNPGVNKSYVDIGIAGDRRRALQAMAHERGHVIGILIDIAIVDDASLYSEVEGLFFQLIGEDFFAKELNDNAFDRFRLEKLLEYYQNTSKLLRCRNVALRTLDELGMRKNPYTAFHFYSDGADFKELDMDDIRKDVFSYLVALELREVYLQDKELAFELLKQIVRPDKERTEFQ